MWGLLALLGIICIMAFLWLADQAPLVDENEQIIQPPSPDFEQYRRFEQ